MRPHFIVFPMGKVLGRATKLESFEICNMAIVLKMLSPLYSLKDQSDSLSLDLKTKQPCQLIHS